MPRTAPPTMIAAPYAAPPCEPGSSLRDLVRGRVRVAGLSAAPIPWPYTHDTADGGWNSKRTLVLTGDLVRAVRTETRAAVAHWWGVDLRTVGRWRAALDVPRMTAGTAARWRELAPKLRRRARR